MATTVSPLSRRFSLAGLLRFAAPSVGMMTVVSLYTVTDGVFIGQYVGSDALAASNIVYPAINVLFGVSIMFSSGGSALVAKNLGEGRRDVARERFTLIAAALVVITTLMALLTGLFMEPILTFLGASPGLYDLCVDYFKILYPFYPAAALMPLFAAFFIVDGRPMLGFLMALVSGLTNALLDYIFLAHLGLGIFGAGLATSIADVVGAVLGFAYFAGMGRIIRFSRPRLSLPVLLRTMGNGVSEMVTQLSQGIVTLLFNLITFRFAGADGVAAISVILYAEMLLNSIYIGYTNGVAPIFSYNHGAKRAAEIRRLLRLSYLTIGTSALLVFTAAQVFTAPLTELFLPDSRNAYDLTYEGLRIFSFSFLLVGFNIFVSGFFTALSDGRTSAVVSFFRNLFSISAFLLVLPEFLGLTGAWLAVPAADACAFFLGLFFLRRLFSRPPFA